LHYAARGAQKDMVELLLKNGADRNLQAKSGTPIAIAHQTDPAIFALLSGMVVVATRLISRHCR